MTPPPFRHAEGKTKSQDSNKISQPPLAKSNKFPPLKLLKDCLILFQLIFPFPSYPGKWNWGGNWGEKEVGGGNTFLKKWGLLPILGYRNTTRSFLYSSVLFIYPTFIQLFIFFSHTFSFLFLWRILQFFIVKVFVFRSKFSFVLNKLHFLRFHGEN